MWEDPKFGTTVTLPSEWVYPGRPGFYLGHLEMGDDAAFADESVNTLPAAPSNQTIAFESALPMLVPLTCSVAERSGSNSS
jgi:hypothetical protein